VNSPSHAIFSWFAFTIKLFPDNHPMYELEKYFENLLKEDKDNTGGHEKALGN
jgi:hypothetical protein